MTTPAIQVDNLTVRFNEQTVLENFSLSVQPGEKLAVTGKSGSGKSTLVRCVLGFTAPQSGKILIEGVPLTRQSVWELRTRIGYVSQEPDLGTGSVREILERPFSYRANVGLEKNLERIPEMFTTFHLSTDLLNKDVVSLSGGEKQRVGLIASLLLDRKIYLLDEVTSALDKANRQTVADFFKSKPELTILSVSHDPESFSFSDRIIDLDKERKERQHDR